MEKKEATSRVDTIVNLLTSRIHDGVYGAGEKLPSERKMQEEFGVGRLALREAISRLNAMGLIETSHGKGTYVQGDVKSRTLKNVLIPYFALNDSRRLKDFVDARAMIESEIAWLAARQRTEKDIQGLETILEAVFDSSAEPEAVAEVDLRFHRQLALLVDNHFLDVMHDALTSHTRAFLEKFVTSKPTYNDVIDAHRPILEAVKNGDAERARLLARQHVTFSMKDFEDFVQRQMK